MASFPSPPPASLLRLQERVGCVWRGGHHSLPKYLRTVFLALGLQPRPSGQALTASITLVSLRQASPGHREGRREEAGAWLAPLGGWAKQNSSLACRALPQPTRLAGIWLHPKGSSLLSEERLRNWRQEGALPGAQDGGGSRRSSFLPWLRLASPPRAGLPQVQAGSDELWPA